MATVIRENLEERIERIRKRTEEIEKKHREAEEDRLMALKDNAMVETKPPKDEDWPKAHKYDKLDFTYDVKPEKLDEINQKQNENEQMLKPKRDYKKFADGEGPPPDPIYNFLADAERDGINVLQQKEQQQQQQQQQKLNDKYDKKESRQNFNNNGGGGGRNTDNNNKNKEQFNKRGGIQQSNSFRNRGNTTNGNSNNGKQHNNRYQKQNSQPEYEQWRSEKIDDNKLNIRQKQNNSSGSNGEKWRRNDWDNNDSKIDKNMSNDSFHNNKSPKHSAANKNNYYHNFNNQQHYQHHQQQQNLNNIFTTDDIVEKRGNIMVSVSPGEVKSVKLTSAQVIGSGRVGPRQLSKPQFHIQTMEKEQQQQVIQNLPGSPRSQNKSGHQQQLQHQLNKSNNYNNQHNNNNHNYQQQQHHNKSLTPPNNRQQSNQPQFNINVNNTSNGSGVVPLAAKSPIKEKRNSRSPKYIPPQQQKILPNLISINGTDEKSPEIPVINNPIIVNNIVNSLLTANTTAINTTVATVIDSNDSKASVVANSGGTVPTPDIDVKVMAVAKELSNKPEFAKKSVQDRLLRIRQMSQPDGTPTGTPNNLNNNQMNGNKNDDVNATLVTNDATEDQQKQTIKCVESIFLAV